MRNFSRPRQYIHERNFDISLISNRAKFHNVKSKYYYPIQQINHDVHDFLPENQKQISYTSQLQLLNFFKNDSFKWLIGLLS